ncbi:VCBS repeat-containing protein [Thioclava sp. DLFJ4-1]|uniref:FG-GAP repeat domain-containing protein n=1 Tax=Thioclava sp. DLFJ4-1 TaxID=1915313 RepID=UPI00099629AF|nr:VCBS repeat-containing protein [Thioclava sp. DLFJ4-1]
MRRAVALACALVTAAALPARAEMSVAAQFTEPTDRYGHGALGPDHEFANLQIDVARKAGNPKGLFSGHSTLTYDLRLDPDMVYEDTSPRLSDLDGDGIAEVIVVQSHLKFGSRLLVLTVKSGKPEFLAATDFVGEPNHWLAPIGVADFNGNGHRDIALIDAPHRLGVLRLFEYRDGALHPTFSGGSFTNHRFGSDTILGGVRDCGAGPEMIVASFDWSELLALSVTPANAVNWTRLGTDTSPGGFANALNCNG